MRPTTKLLRDKTELIDAARISLARVMRAVGDKYRVLISGSPVEALVMNAIGFIAKPPRDEKSVAVCVWPEAGPEPIVIGGMSEAGVAPDIGDDESAVYNTVSLVHVRDDGTVEARTKAGVAVPLATLADLTAHRDWAETHGHASHGAVPSVTPPTPTGTQKFKAE